jgi:N-acetylneuraminate synthase/sialic acid synthase
MREIILGGKRIDDSSPAYVIAEIGHNHGGDLNLCLSMIAAAKKAGCDAIKLQKRTNRELYTEEMYNSPYTGRNSYGRTYGEHRGALEFDEARYLAVQEYCKHIKIDFGVTAFDVQAAKFVARLKPDFIKLASGDLESLPLIREVAKFNLPVIFSTGGATGMLPILGTHNELKRYGAPVAVLQCTSGYPAEWEDLNLRCITEFRKVMPQTVIGWSMHARGISQSVAAYTLGARIVEAHFTLDRYAKGTDQAMSLEPKGMAAMVRYMRFTRDALGDGVKRRLPAEIGPLKKQWKNKDGKVDGKGGIYAE